MRNVSVLMLTYGHWEYTMNALMLLMKNVSPCTKLNEIIIFDTIPNMAREDYKQRKDYTQQGLLEFQQQYGKDFFKIVSLGLINYGIPILIRRGIQMSKSENDIVFCNNDIFLGPNWLQPLIDLAYKDKWYTQHVAMVSPFQSPELSWDQYINAEFREIYFKQFYHRFIYEKNPQKIQEILNEIYQGNFEQFSKEFVERNRGKIWDDEVNGSCFLLKRDVLNTGLVAWDDRYSYLFNGDTGGYGADDQDFSVQLDNAGYFRMTCFESFAHHLVCGTDRKITLDDAEMKFKDIQSGNKFSEKWERDYEAPEIIFPFDLAPGIPKAPHKHRWKLRTTPMPEGRDPLRLDWGVGRAALNIRIDD